MLCLQMILFFKQVLLDMSTGVPYRPAGCGGKKVDLPADANIY